MSKRLNIVLVVVSLVLGISLHWYLKNSAVERALEAQKASYELKFKEEMTKAQESSIKLLNSAMADLQKKENEIKNINIKLSTLTSELQQRTSRENSSSNTRAPSPCTGAFLYREDSEFLAREAARADRILKERDYYYENYQHVRRELQAFKESTGR